MTGVKSPVEIRPKCVARERVQDEISRQPRIERTGVERNGFEDARVCHT